MAPVYKTGLACCDTALVTDLCLTPVFKMFEKLVENTAEQIDILIAFHTVNLKQHRKRINEYCGICYAFCLLFKCYI